MKQKIAKKWIEKLRSGTIPQIQTHLGNVEGGRCCLGVLCDLAVEEGVIDAPRKGTKNFVEWSHRSYLIYDDSEESLLPDSVTTWADIKNHDGFYYTKTGKDCSLSGLNDRGKTFEEIADVIEQNWKKL